jgi:hypothetical protein
MNATIGLSKKMSFVYPKFLQAAGIHHGVIGLNDQHWIFPVYEYRDFQDVPGYPGTTAVVGDALVDLDPSNQPVWVWQAFDHLCRI